MTAYATAIADPSRRVLLVDGSWRRRAGEAGVDRLSQRTERICAGVELVGQSLARVGFERELGGDVVLRRL